MPYQPRAARRFTRVWRILSLVLIASMFLAQAAPVIEAATIASRPLARSNYTVSSNQVIGVDVAATEDGVNANGLTITLSEGADQPDEVIRPRLAEAQLLTDDTLQLILDRLPPLETEATDEQEFRLPPQSLPAPRPGETVIESFPPAPTQVIAPDVAEGPLEVLRYSPEGEIPLAPFLNVTFNQPMVALGTLEQLSATDVPVQITPEIPGRWKWLGTKTLSFEYESEDVDRFPMATEFTVEIPAGTESATGSTLVEAVTWTFKTPPPQVVNFLPSGGPQPRNPLLFVSFNQQIDPAAVLETISVTAGGDAYELMLASAEEIAQNEQISRTVESLVDSGNGDQWLAFRATEEFPANTTVVVNVGPGTPSAEGPLTSGHVQSYSFQTYAPLRVVEYSCGYGECPPFSPFTVQFNNPIDSSAFDAEMVTAEPEIAGMDVDLFGSNLVIQGATQGRTTYEITLSKEIGDIFGQTLGEDVALEFEVGSAFPLLNGPNDAYITLDPSAEKPVFTVYSINYERLRVRAYKVSPDDWSDYLTYRQNYFGQENAPEPPGDEVLREVFTVQAQPDQLAETSIDLSAVLGGETGHLIVIVDFPGNPLLGATKQRQYDNTIQTWVQVTQIGLDAFVDNGNMVVWTNALTDGAPLAGVDVRLVGTQVSATTGADGTALLPLSNQTSTLLVAQKGDDLAILPPNRYVWGGDGWRALPQSDELRWYVMDDRGMYRPNEEVHVKGFVRRIAHSQNSDVELIGGAQNSVRYVLFDPQGNEILDGTASVSELGGFDLAFTLPENINLGFSNLQLSLAGNVSNLDSREYWHQLQVQEFRRPEFAVTAGNETMGPYYVADEEAGEAVVFVSAQYFAGGALPNAETFWTVRSTPTSYAPPNWPDFTFGTWVPWWRFYDDVYPGSDGGQTLNYNATTDAAGTHYLRMRFEKASEPRPYSVVADATVMDVNRQAWAASTSLLVHPAELYVGLRSDSTFVEMGEPLTIDAIVTDIDGNAVAGRAIEMRTARLDWEYVDGQWQEVEADVQECSIDSADEPVTCTFATEMGGSYRITARVTDDAGRANESQLMRWVSGGQRPPARNVEQEEVQLIPNQEEYQPGDEAEILVQSPFVPAEGLLTVARSGILFTERFTMDEASHILRIPIEDAHIPNLHVQVDLVGAAPRVDDEGEPMDNVPLRPAYATGTLNLSIPPLNRTLDLAIEPQETALEPGGATTIDVTLTDASGDPVAGAEMVAVVVDEAILALSNYQLTDPIATFYSSRWSDLRSYYSRASIVLANPEALATLAQTEASEAVMNRAAAPAAAPMATADMAFAAGADVAEEAAMDGEMSQAGQAQAPISVRTDFNPLATFAPAVETDANGQAQVEVQLPDNLTRYRVMVVAVAEGRYFGSGESNLTARLPLMVRPSAPRFLNFGDHFELPVVVQNQTDQEMAVDVGVRVGNITVDEPVIGESTGKSITVPANDRVEVRFPVGTLNAGTARFQIAAVSGSHADAQTIDLAVYTPATTEAFATYGVVDTDASSGGAVAQPLLKPENVFPQFGGLEINTSSTALQALTDAVLYLVAYPYECSEQLASRVLTVAALRDVLTAFEAEGLPSPEELIGAMQRDIDRLQSLQNFDGGWPIWRKGQESIPYYSIHVAHALQRAKEKGFQVSDETQARTLDHLRNIEQFYPHWYSAKVRHTLSSYAVYVRMLMGDVDTAKARDLYGRAALNNQSLEAVAWLWQVLSGDPASAQQVAEIRTHINNRAVETAGAANFTTGYGDEAYLLLHSDRRTDGIILDALINDQPESDLIPKVVNGLLAQRTRGRWNNTQENAFILLALDRYFNTFEAVEPDFVANIWLGEEYVGGHEFEGRTTERHQTEVPMAYLVNDAFASAENNQVESQDLIIGKEGPGRLYYRLGLRYAPTDLDLPPLDMGFVVAREYEAVDDPADVERDENGVWRMRAGARVRVRVTMVADNRRYHVALVDPLPAGLEIINPALAVSEDVPPDPNDPARRTWWWWGTWYEHQNLRDQRAEAFTTLLWDGVYTYSYVARATTPGEFVVPPAKAEEMYSPEVFGRSGVDRVIVE